LREYGKGYLAENDKEITGRDKILVKILVRLGHQPLKLGDV